MFDCWRVVEGFPANEQQHGFWDERNSSVSTVVGLERTGVEVICSTRRDASSCVVISGLL